jgi:hypothetical protein
MLMPLLLMLLLFMLLLRRLLQPQPWTRLLQCEIRDFRHKQCQL